MCMCKNIGMGSYENQISIKPPFVGHSIGIDKCIAEEVQYLWSLGIKTTGCCCGHNKVQGCIGVYDEHIPKMKALGYIVHHNRCRPKDEDSFIPKSI